MHSTNHIHTKHRTLSGGSAIRFCRRSLMPGVSLLVLALALAACAQPFDRSKHFNLDAMALEDPRSEAEKENQRRTPSTDDDPTIEAMKSDAGPQAPVPNFQMSEPALSPEALEGEPLQVAANNLPLPAFIDEVFGEKLGLSYAIAPGLRERSDLVTLRLNQPMPPQELFRAARSVLTDYGVGITEEEGVLRFIAAADATSEEIPLLVTGETLPDVPASHRPVFQVIELSVISNSQARGALRDILDNTKVKLSDDPMRNALIIRGPAAEVEKAVRALNFFDRPMMKGRHSLILRPAYRDIAPLASALSDVLSSQGYSVGRPGGTGASVIILPMEEMEVIVALANDRDVLQHIKHWAEQLDQDYQREIESGVFTYEVQNTSAANLAELISELYGESFSGESSGTGRETTPSNTDSQNQQNTSNRNSTSNRRSSGGSANSTEVAGGRLVVDERRNVLIYRGTGRGWMEIRDIVRDLDKQVPSVLMEVLLAEVTLGDTYGTGVEWLAQGALTDGYSATFGTEGGLGLGEQGFTFNVLNSAGNTKAVLNAFYDSNRAVIRSSPKIMVKSGEEARIEVGNEIPVITSRREGDTQTDGTSDVTQQYQFRQTGVDLTVVPVVQASGLVDIQISQTLSETQDTGSGGDFLPTILNRTVETSLTLRDGGSVVLGGLISESKSSGEQGVPFLGRIPLLGQLFRSNSDTTNTTELLIMVVPYVIRNDEEADRVSRELQRRIERGEEEALAPEAPVEEEE